MHIHKILSAEEIQLQGPVVLAAQQLELDDPTLPPARGRLGRKRPVNHSELARLKAIRRFGGLVPLIKDPQYWQCPSCPLIHSDRQVVSRCCQQIPNRIQVCENCLESRRGLFRIGECQCEANKPNRKLS